MQLHRVNSSSLLREEMQSQNIAVQQGKYTELDYLQAAARLLEAPGLVILSSVAADHGR